jgi:hypothetical protein
MLVIDWTLSVDPEFCRFDNPDRLVISLDTIVSIYSELAPGVTDELFAIDRGRVELHSLHVCSIEQFRKIVERPNMIWLGGQARQNGV